VAGLLPAPASTSGLTEAQARLRGMVLDAVTSPHSRRNYAKALDDLFAFAAGRSLTRALLLEWRASMSGLAPSTVNVRLSAVRKLVGEAHKNGMLGSEEAEHLGDIPNIRQKGRRMGNWLTREQAKEILAVPDRSTLKGKRDYVILALLVGCALRRQELASLYMEEIQMREGRWVIADLLGKGGRIGEGLSDWAIWSVVEQAAKQIGIERFGAHDLRRTCAKLCRKSGGDLEQIKFLLGHSSIQTTERYLGSEQEISVAVNDTLGL
jgi:integrase